MVLISLGTYSAAQSASVFMGCITSRVGVISASIDHAKNFPKAFEMIHTLPIVNIVVS